MSPDTKQFKTKTEFRVTLERRRWEVLLTNNFSPAGNTRQEGHSKAWTRPRQEVIIHALLTQDRDCRLKLDENLRLTERIRLKSKTEARFR